MPSIQKMRRCLVLTFLLQGLSVSLLGCRQEAPLHTIGILQWTERIYSFQETYQGFTDILNSHDFHETGGRLKFIYRNVEESMETADRMVRELIEEDVDLIVALGTGSTLAAIQARPNRSIPIIYSIVGAPVATGIIGDENVSGGNITGVSMRIPAREQLDTIRSVLPSLTRLGVIYSTEMPQAVATGHEMIAAANELGWKVKSSALPKTELHRLKETITDLAQQVDAVFIPTDPVLCSPENLSIIFEICDRLKIPVLGTSEQFIQQGVLMAVHCDFYEIGKQTGAMAVQWLNHTPIEDIPSKAPLIKFFSLNLKKARKLDLFIHRNIIIQADNLYD